MEVMNEVDFQALLNGPMGKYYEGRWAYFCEVIQILNSDPAIRRVLELGPAIQSIVKNCDIMVKPELDIWGRPEKYVSRFIEHDATVTPWPIADKEYDMFIALQVWEHLVGRQQEAFREVMRISKSAVLSFPYLWDCPKDNANYPEHHMIDEKIIADWTLHVEPVKVIHIPRTGEKVSKGPRIIYYWRF